jgi:SRSO17 transposase
MAWDEAEANERRVAVLRAMKTETEEDGVLIIAPTDFPKQSQRLSGWARQYSESLGRVPNCQVMVN